MKKGIIGKKESEQAHEFSEEDIQFIQKLNEKLRKEEQRFLALHDKLKPHLTTLCEQREIDDFNYDTRLGVFAKGRDCNARYGVVYGDPIWEDKTWSLFTDERSREFLEENWNELRDLEHPLSDIHFCYTMHCVVFHSHLLWKDILCIEDVWLELKIDYQFLSNDKEKRRFHKLNKERIAEDRLM